MMNRQNIHIMYMLVPKCALSQFANWDPSLRTRIYLSQFAHWDIYMLVPKCALSQFANWDSAHFGTNIYNVMRKTMPSKYRVEILFYLKFRLPLVMYHCHHPQTSCCQNGCYYCCQLLTVQIELTIALLPALTFPLRMIETY